MSDLPPGESSSSGIQPVPLVEPAPVTPVQPRAPTPISEPLPSSASGSAGVRSSSRKIKPRTVGFEDDSSSGRKRFPKFEYRIKTCNSSRLVLIKVLPDASKAGRSKTVRKRGDVTQRTAQQEADRVAEMKKNFKDHFKAVDSDSILQETYAKKYRLTQERSRFIGTHLFALYLRSLNLSLHYSEASC